MSRGIIYKIFSPEYGDSRVYIGQTRQTLDIRWGGHQRAAEESSKKQEFVERGKSAKLHKAISVLGNTQIVQLEVHEYEDKNELKNKLNARENYFINKYNSIENGWNKVLASRVELSIGVKTSETWEDIANRHGVDKRKLMYQVNKTHSIEEAVEIVKSLSKKRKRILVYGMQEHHFVKELEIYNKNKIPRKTIEKRIRDLVNKNQIRIEIDEESNTEKVILKDEVFDELDDKRQSVTVNTPEGQMSGLIAELHRNLLPIYPDLIPDNYGTIQSRITNRGWTPDQAFGFRYPPKFEDVEELVKKRGYVWGKIDGISKEPQFKNIGRTISKPIIMKSKFTVYISEKDWCDAYKLKDRKTIKKLFDEGRTPEEVLKKYKKTP